jgi:uncharacterized membrane protein SpoIIM required for sporulation
VEPACARTLLPLDVDTFIDRYRDEWSRLERAVSGDRSLTRSAGPEIREVVRLYLRATNHLAEARARYVAPDLEAYLNRLVIGAQAAIYSARPRSLRAFARLFAIRYPQALRRTLPYILVAGGILLVVVVGSWWWLATDPRAQAGLIPDAARAALRRAGAVRTDLPPPPALSTMILFNNVQVAVFAFALGITFCIGTIVIVVRNALVLGLLAGAYQAAGTAGPFWSLILPHGILELIAICIAAGAGLRIGWAVIDPGDRRRGLALREEAGEAAVVVVGVIPAFGVAAFIEGFVTGRVPAGVAIALGVLVAGVYLAFLSGRLPRITGVRRS